jgi:lipopolysaccharide biosynthesis glycosyltransferase
MTSIVITPDEFYLPYVPCLLAQIARYGSHAERVIIVIPEATQSESLTGVKTLARMHDIELCVVPLSHADCLRIAEFTPLSYDGGPSYFTYVRLLLAEILTYIDDVLYLDVDILIRGPLDDLIAWKLHHPLGAVPELVGTGAHLFGTSQLAYFNGGILRMSLERMRQERIWEQSQKILASRKDIRWFDQDVLNIVFQGRFDSLPLTFNVSDMLIRKRLELPLFDDPAVVHFNGPIKPWHSVAKSSFSREWRKRNSEVATATLLCHNAEVNKADGQLSKYAVSCVKPHAQVISMAGSLLPAKVKRVAKRAVSAFVDRLVCHLEGMQSRLHPVPHLKLDALQHTPWSARHKNSIHEGMDFGSFEEQSGLDLLISVARSGTNALGAILQCSRPDVHWMNELYLGAGWGNLRDGELAGQFPWFDSHGPDSIEGMTPRQRPAAFRAFTETMSAHAVDLTATVLKSRQGRTLIKVFPDQLNFGALEEVMRVFRPRILFVRREMIFTYVSRLRAIQLDEYKGTFAKSWKNADLTNVHYTIDERSALEYAAHCDAWFDSVENLANNLGLNSTWLTYGGLFTTGYDVPLLQNFYPGLALPVESDSSGLQSSLKIQDRRTDASVIVMLKAVSALSGSAQAQLLRLPGTHGKIYKA